MHEQMSADEAYTQEEKTNIGHIEQADLLRKGDAT
jgi:hypothetical protein